MKIYQIVSEDLDEAPVGGLKRAGQAVGRFFGSQAAAGAEEVSDEANNLKKQLSQWMGKSGIKKGQLTFGDLEKFLSLTGYSGLAASELEKAKSQKTLSQRVKGAAGQAAGAVGSAARSAGQTIKNISGVVPADQINQSMYEQESEVLSNAVVDRILLSVVQKAAKQSSTGVEKGKFAGASVADTKTKSKKPKLPADVVQIISNLPKDQQKKIIQAITKTAG